MDTNDAIAQLLVKPIWQMTGEEFLQLNEYSRSRTASSLSEGASESVEYAHGVSELAQKIGCSVATVFSLKKAGVLDGAVVSHIGKKIIFDVNKARTLADEFRRKRRV